jgi:hypothetical protein
MSYAFGLRLEHHGNGKPHGSRTSSVSWSIFQFALRSGHVGSKLGARYHAFVADITHLLQAPCNPRSIDKALSWPDAAAVWQAAIDAAELASHRANGTFSPFMELPPGATIVGHVWRLNYRYEADQKTIARRKACLCGNGSTQTAFFDYKDTYSPTVWLHELRILLFVMIFFQWLMELVDIVTVYLYGGHVDVPIYMTVPRGIPIPPGMRHWQPCIQIHRMLYGLKQSGLLWYCRLKDFLLSKAFTTNPITPCLFFSSFCTQRPGVLAVFVDDMNLVGNRPFRDHSRDILGHESESNCLTLGSHHTVWASNLRMLQHHM